jgi:hypothetical protein
MGLWGLDTPDMVDLGSWHNPKDLDVAPFIAYLFII